MIDLLHWSLKQKGASHVESKVETDFETRRDISQLGNAHFRLIKALAWSILMPCTGLAGILLLFVAFAEPVRSRKLQIDPPSPPVVVATEPLNGATDVSLLTTLKVHFGEAMNAATVNAATFVLYGSNGPITGSVTYGGQTAIFAPGQPLDPFSIYTATLSSPIQDLAGVPLSIYIWTFATGFDSNLPIVVVDTAGAPIQDDPKIPASMQIFWEKNGGRNRLSAPLPTYAGRIGIEIRGNSSQAYHKKQYGFETRDANNRDINTVLLDLPAESDWILQGPYIDRTLMRNFFAYTLSNRMGRYAARTRFVELFLNDTGSPGVNPEHYLGVYLLMEKIKRDNNRVAISKLYPNQDRAPAISGGYIVKLDAVDPGDLFFYTALGNHQIIYVEPEGDEISIEQQAWLQNYFNEFEQALASDGFADRDTGYVRFIDVDAFIDHLLLNELMRNVDAYRVSTYLHKDRNGKLMAGPVWDFDLSGGYVNLAGSQHPDGWHVHRSSSAEHATPFWWARLLEDNCFLQRLALRWLALRQGSFHTSQIETLITATVSLLNEAQTRNFQRWPVLGRKIFMEEFVGQTYAEDVAYFQDWLHRRAVWMDQNIKTLSTRQTAQPPGLCILPVDHPLVLGLDNSTRFHIGLASQPAGAVSVGLRHTTSLSLTVTPATLTFLTSTWDSPQTVTVRLEDMPLQLEGPLTYTLSLNVPSSADPAYAALGTQTKTFTMTAFRHTDLLYLPLVNR